MSLLGSHSTDSRGAGEKPHVDAAVRSEFDREASASIAHLDGCELHRQPGTYLRPLFTRSFLLSSPDASPPRLSEVEIERRWNEYAGRRLFHRPAFQIVERLVTVGDNWDDVSVVNLERSERFVVRSDGVDDWDPTLFHYEITIARLGTTTGNAAKRLSVVVDKPVHDVEGQVYSALVANVRAAAHLAGATEVDWYSRCENPLLSDWVKQSSEGRSRVEPVTA